MGASSGNRITLSDNNSDVFTGVTVVGWLNPDPDPLLGTFVPSRLELLCPRRRGRRRRDVDRRVRRRVGRPDDVPVRYRRLRMALTGPDVARPVEVTLRRTGHAMCVHGRVALRRTDSGRCDGDGRGSNRRSRQRDGRRRASDGQTAKKPRHARPPCGSRCDFGCAPAYVLKARRKRQLGRRREMGHHHCKSGRRRGTPLLVDDNGH